MILSHPGQLAYKPTRIVSLVPSLTELLHYLELEEETIGITKFCVHPPGWFSTKTRIGGTKTVDIEKITGLNPDLIIANKEENIKAQVETLAQHFPVWVTDVNNLPEAFRMIEDIGMLTQKENLATGLISTSRQQFEQLSEINKAKTRIRTVYLIWKDPYMTAGTDTFIHAMLEAIGLQNIIGQKRYPPVSIEELKRMNFEIMLLSSEPYPFKQQHVDALLKELPGKKIMLVDGEFFSWYGSRLSLAPGYFIKLIGKIRGSL